MYLIRINQKQLYKVGGKWERLCAVETYKLRENTKDIINLREGNINSGKPGNVFPKLTHFDHKILDRGSKRQIEKMENDCMHVALAIFNFNSYLNKVFTVLTNIISVNTL